MGFWSKLFGKKQDDSQPETEVQEEELVNTEAPAEEVATEAPAEEVAEEASEETTEDVA
jgi:hypothetical protein